MSEYSYNPQAKIFSKTCPKCTRVFEGAIDETESQRMFSLFFSKDKYTRDGFYGTCKLCVASYMRAKRDGRNCDPEAILEDQSGYCAICTLPLTFDRMGSRVTAYVDHNHDTGKVCGILCVRCNSMLSTKDWLLKALAYLQKHGE